MMKRLLSAQLSLRAGANQLFSSFVLFTGIIIYITVDIINQYCCYFTLSR